mmetsp:Transcript_19922/g.52000  ORF Transcript_19922/g.52000 Transcript_19922/m.52000 type:complete len:223 (+) Transcript_19922:429-1097(+)
MRQHGRLCGRGWGGARGPVGHAARSPTGKDRDRDAAGGRHGGVAAHRQALARRCLLWCAPTEALPTPGVARHGRRPRRHVPGAGDPGPVPRRHGPQLPQPGASACWPQTPRSGALWDPTHRGAIRDGGGCMRCGAPRGAAQAAPPYPPLARRRVRASRQPAGRPKRAHHPHQAVVQQRSRPERRGADCPGAAQSAGGALHAQLPRPDAAQPASAAPASVQPH